MTQPITGAGEGSDLSDARAALKALIQRPTDTQWNAAELAQIREQGPQGPLAINRIKTTAEDET